ncbi:MAG: HEAT repeat domain-containing protein, partial [Chloroflexota bacterium]
HIQWLQKVQYEASDWQQQEKPDRLLWDYEELQPVYEAIDHLKITLDPVTSEFVRPQTERLLDDFETTPEYRQLSIIDRWREIGEDAAPALVGALAYAKGDIVLESIDRALWQIPHAAEKALMDAMSSGDPNVREAVADAAGRLGVVNTVRGLLDNIKADSRAYCLAEIKAITALAASAKTNRDTVPALLAVLKDHEKRTVDERQAAAEALGFVIDKSDRQAVEALVTCMDGKHADKNWEVREAVVMALGQIGKKDSGLIGVLIRKTREKGEAFHVQRAAIDTLGQLRQRKAMNVLINAAVDNRDDIRHAAVRALAVLETEDVLSMLMYRLKDESPKVRKATAEALGAFGHAHAWRPLVDALETEKVSSVRVAIVEALECYPDKYDVARALRRAIQDDTASVRAAAAHALSEMNKDQHGRNIKALLEGFKDRDTDVKLAVIRALGHLQTNQATQTMFNTLRGNRTWRIRFEGAVALAAIRDDSIEDDLRKILEGKDSDAAFAAAVVLAGLGDDSPRVKKELLGVLEDPRLEARCIAAGALGKLKDSETLQQLLGELTNQNPMVREAIAEAIRAVNDGSATPDLRDLLNYPFQGVREAANTAIGY